MAVKKQTKADKAFVAKIATIGLNLGAKAPKTCPDCGKPMMPVGMVAGMFHGTPVVGPVYAHKTPVPVHDDGNEQSLSA